MLDSGEKERQMKRGFICPWMKGEKEMKNKRLWRKITVLCMVAVMVFGMTACGGDAQGNAGQKDVSQEKESDGNKEEDVDKAEDVEKEDDVKGATKDSDAVSYQFIGTYGELEDRGMAYAMKMNLYGDGSAELDRYNYVAQGTNGEEPSEDSEVYVTDEPYEEAFMTGTWENSEKDGVECLAITVHATDEEGNAVNEVTCYAYEISGEYSFEMTFPLVVGMKYTRIITLSGTSEVVYADADSFIAEYKAN